MRVLLAVDGSSCSDAVVRAAMGRAWPEGTEMEVFSAVHAWVPLIPDPTMTGFAMHEESLAKQKREGEELVAGVARKLAEDGRLKVTTKVVEGNPKDAVVDEAEDWEADLLLVGSHGRSAMGRFLLGSVSHAAALHAPCSVEIVRSCN